MIMTSFCKVSIMACFLLATGAFLASPALAFQANEQDFELAAEPSSSYDPDIIPPDLHHYLDECLKKLGTECGPEFFEKIFVGQNNEIPTSCCQKQVQMGQNCHNAITDTVISRPEFSANATLFHTRAAETWKMCCQVVKNASPSPSA